MRYAIFPVTFLALLAVATGAMGASAATAPDTPPGTSEWAGTVPWPPLRRLPPTVRQSANGARAVFASEIHPETI